MRTIVALATLLALTGPAFALCVANPGEDSGYPQGKEALLLCQQAELSDAISDRAAAEQLRAMRAQLQALQLQQQRLQLRPLPAFEIPRF
jgi:hypothetical protein